MGQYHNAVNLDKREFFEPHSLGMGLKQWEQATATSALALIALMSCSNNRGGGDLPVVEGVNGRWTGDRIAYVGDYTEAGDIDYPGIEYVYAMCGATQEDADELDEDGNRYFPEGTTPFTDITPLVASYIETAENGMFVGSGWKQFITEGGRYCMWNPERTLGNEKLHGTVQNIDRNARSFDVAWDGGDTVSYQSDGDRGTLPYLMPSDMPGPRMVVDMMLTE